MNCKTLLQATGILTGPHTYLDHLGVLCSLLDIPLIVTDPNNEIIAQKFYPQLNVVYKDYSELTFDFLAQNFNFIFESGRFWAAEMLPFFEAFYPQKMRLVFCPHGNSDKGHSIQHVAQDISLVYGQHMVDLLQSTGALNRISATVRTGNYRLPFYRKHKSFYDHLAQTKVFAQLGRREKTIFYAPSWQDGENRTSFFDNFAELIAKLPEKYNLVVKLHPFLEEFHPAHTYHLLAQYENRPNVTIINEFPPIYPLLDYCDIYLGDFSSIGYDFLAFDKPLYFFHSDQKRTLSRCGLEIPVGAEVYRFISDTLADNEQRLSEIRKATYVHAFGEEREAEQIKKEIRTLSLVKDRVLN